MYLLLVQVLMSPKLMYELSCQHLDNIKQVNSSLDVFSAFSELTVS